MNEKVFKAIDLFTIQLLNILSSYYKRDLPIRHRIIYKFFDNGRIEHTLMPRINYSRDCREFNKLIFSNPSYEELVNVLLEGKILHTPQLIRKGVRIENPTVEQIKPWIIGQLDPLYDEYFNEFIDFRYDQKILKEKYKEFEKVVTAKDRFQNILLPLINFNMETEKIRLDENLEISKFTGEDKNRIWLQIDDPIFRSYKMDMVTFANCKFKIHCSNKLTDKISNSIPDECGILIEALRTLHKGKVSIDYNFNYIQPLLKHGFYVQGIFQEKYSIPPRNRTREYKLLESEIDQLKELYTTLKTLINSRKYDSIALGVSRFNTSYSRSELTDRVLDLTITLESLLLHGDQDELSYRLAIRGSKLLADKENPIETFQFLRAAYNVRSKLVHEGQSLTKIKTKKRYNLTPDHFVEKLENTVRAVILELVHRMNPGKGLKTIIEELDLSIINQTPIDTGEEIENDG